MEDKNEMRITPEEKSIIEQTFGGNTKLLKLMRKIFLPEYDPSAPLGQAVDLWTTKDVSQMTPEEAKIYFMARRDLILHVESQLLQLYSLSQKVETAEEVLERMKKNSTK